MARQPTSKSYYQYVGDNGALYRIKIMDYIATQVDGAGDSIIGATPALGTEQKIGSGGALRRAIVRDLVNHRDRVVVVMSPNAPLIRVPTPAGASGLILNHNLDSYSYTYQGLFLTQERARR